MKIYAINNGLASNIKTSKNYSNNKIPYSSSNNSFDLPSISFKMAHIDMDEARTKNKLFQKYIADNHFKSTYNHREAHPEKNESPVFYMDSKELESACQELSQYPFLLKKMFLVQDRYGNFPVQNFDDKQLAIMVMALKEYLPDKADEILKKIFSTPVSNGILPAHNFKDPKSLATMREAVGEDESVSILTKKDREGFYPINRYFSEPGMIYKTIEIMKNHKPELIKVLTHSAPTYEEKIQKYSNVLQHDLGNDKFLGRDNIIHSDEELIMDSDDIQKAIFYLKKDDINLIFDIFKDSEDDLRRILFSKDKYGSSFIFNCDSNVEEALYNNLRSKNYVNLLKDLYTCDLNGMAPSELPQINKRHILELASDSDLDEKSSLEMLKINKNALMKTYPSEYYTIVNALEEKIEKLNK